MRPKQPCPKECPDRSPECRGKCEKWLTYEKALHEFYKERVEAYNQAYILNEIERDRYLKLKTGRVRKKRGYK